ncbi:MAG: hypothetical protein H6Q17_286 [Bacteroidetes bacterium]|jgi:hypothetical protein|nr:hypothetical protein [Bacteroidota bacterium]
MKVFNKFWIGLLISIILPIVFGLTYFNMAYRGDQSMWEALFLTAKSGLPLFGKLILLSTFPDLGLIFIFYKADYWHACRGTIVATALFFVISFIYLS